MKTKHSVTIQHITIRMGQELLYDGPFKDLPLPEEIILQKSIFFFDDPDPCYIHRTAVHLRILAEIEHELLTCTAGSETSGIPGNQLPLFLELTLYSSDILIFFVCS